MPRADKDGHRTSLAPSAEALRDAQERQLLEEWERRTRFTADPGDAERRDQLLGSLGIHPSQRRRRLVEALAHLRVGGQP